MCGSHPRGAQVNGAFEGDQGRAWRQQLTHTCRPDVAEVLKKSFHTDPSHLSSRRDRAWPRPRWRCSSRCRTAHQPRPSAPGPPAPPRSHLFPPRAAAPRRSDVHVGQKRAGDARRRAALASGTAFGVLVWRRDAASVLCITGAVINAIFSKILKRLINESRPAGAQESDPACRRATRCRSSSSRRTSCCSPPRCQRSRCCRPARRRAWRRRRRARPRQPRRRAPRPLRSAHAGADLRRRRDRLGRRRALAAVGAAEAAARAAAASSSRWRRSSS